MSITATVPKGHVMLEQLDTIADAVISKMATKVDKVDGRQLSANNFTDALRNKLEGISEVTTDASGLMSAADKVKLDSIDPDASNYTHPDSGITAGTYNSVTVDAQGHVTEGTNPTTLAGYGITDAPTVDGTGATGTWDIGISGKANTAGTADTSSACTGNSATATKLETARTISLIGNVTGSASFDGSADVSISTEDSLGLINIINTVGLSHNGIYRGKYLGTFSGKTEFEQFITDHEISSGVFKDLYVGDYCTIKDGTYNVDWEIAGFDCYIYKGWNSFTNHHVVLIPKTNLTNAYMNSSASTDGGYYNSYMHQTIIPQIDTALTNVLGDHLLSRQAILSNASSSDIASGAGAGWTGGSTGWTWYTVKSCLMSELAVYGTRIFASSFHDTGEDCERLPIYQFKHPSYNRQGYWLRSVASSSNFAIVAEDGVAGYTIANYSGIGVRPTICVG